MCATAIATVIGSSACSNSATDSDTAAICSQAPALRAPDAVADTKERWRQAGAAHPAADRRLLDAIALMQEAVPDQGTLVKDKWNQAHELLNEVCG
jgi:hypothetical protein